ncbi:MAG: hypothetical protein KU37_05225 [Sulfuricurvum sp. PC08-66]|nr:MAG: hypothetical protein KU37_05225 [Sulfuricurvum sp. PC08-66]
MNYEPINYEALLRTHQLKATPQRIGILNAMHTHGHITIDTLYSDIKKEFSAISLATLYKNIHQMMDATLVTEVKIAQQKTLYEITKAAHAHLACDRCGSVYDIAIDATPLVAQQSPLSQHRIESAQITFTGVCQGCLTKGA